MKEGKILASRCPTCGRVFLPPRMTCERCFVRADEWVELPDTRTVHSFTDAHVKVGKGGDLEDLESPEIIAMVMHDGADTCLVARLEGGNAAVGVAVYQSSSYMKSSGCKPSAWARSRRSAATTPP